MWAITGVAHKSLFSVGKIREIMIHVLMVPVIGPTGRAPQRTPATNPTMPPPSFPPEDGLAVNAHDLSGVQIQEIQEGDEEMEEVEEEHKGSGVGAFLAPPRKKTVKKTFLKKTSAKNVSVKPETRSSVFAEAGTLSARELTRLAEGMLGAG